MRARHSRPPRRGERGCAYSLGTTAPDSNEAMRLASGRMLIQQREPEAYFHALVFAGDIKREAGA